MKKLLTVCRLAFILFIGYNAISLLLRWFLTDMKLFFDIIPSAFNGLFSVIFNPFVIFAVTVAIIIFATIIYNYKKTTYYEQTKTPYLKLRSDVGKLGEYMIYKNLKKYEKTGAKFLFNVYIPKKDEETTEIDVVMICKKGIFVFESKNYSGWIFGDEKSFKWTQSLPSGRKSHKEQFYNPIMQNKTHIKYLAELLEDDNLIFHSVIAFSDRCTLKSVTLNSKDIKVINRYNVDIAVQNICSNTPSNILSESDVINIYDKLLPYTQVDESLKQQHIENINNKLSKNEEKPPILTNALNVGDGENTENTEEKVLKKCPKCDGDLVERVAKRGDKAGQKFLGCSNFPKCKYME